VNVWDGMREEENITAFYLRYSEIDYNTRSGFRFSYTRGYAATWFSNGVSWQGVQAMGREISGNESLWVFSPVNVVQHLFFRG